MHAGVTVCKTDTIHPNMGICCYTKLDSVCVQCACYVQAARLKTVAAAAAAAANGSSAQILTPFQGTPMAGICSDLQLRLMGILLQRLGLTGALPTAPPFPGTQPAATGEPPAANGGAPASAQLPPAFQPIAPMTDAPSDGPQLQRPQLEGVLGQLAAAASLQACIERQRTAVDWARMIIPNSGVESTPPLTGVPKVEPINYLDGGCSGTGEAVHPLIRLMLSRPPPVYVADHGAHNLSASGEHADDGAGHDGDGAGGAGHDEAGDGGAAGAGGRGGKAKAAVQKAPVKTPTGPASAATPPMAGTPPGPELSADGGGEESAAGGGHGEVSGMSGAVTRGGGGGSEAASGGGGGGVTPAPAGDQAGQPSSARGGRARTTTTNYQHLLAGKKDKAAVVTPPPIPTGAKPKRPRGRPPSVHKANQAPAASSAAAFAATAALLSKAASGAGLGEEDVAGVNAVVAAVAGCVAAGAAEGPTEEQWPVLDGATDLLAMAPDDEILAELLAVQSELVQQVGWLVGG